MTLKGEKPQEDLRNLHKSPFVLTFMLCSFIGCQHQCYPYYCLRKGTRATLAFGNAANLLQRAQFVASRLTIFETLLRTMDRSNAKLDEGVKHLSYDLLAVFCVGKLSTP